MFAYDYERMLELLKIEQTCVKRGSGLDENFKGACNRDCAHCDLVQKDEDLLDMYEKVIRLVGREVERTKREKRYKEQAKREREWHEEFQKRDPEGYWDYIREQAVMGEGW